jgi:hypothetical protein
MIQLWIPYQERHITSPAWILLALGEAMVLLPVIVAFRPTRTRTIASAVLFAFITWTSLRYRFDAPFVESYLYLSMHATVLCNWVDKVLLQHPDKQRWHKIYPRSLEELESEDDKDKFQVPQSYWARLKWSLGSSVALRGSGWSFQVKNIPNPPPIGCNRW